MIQKPPPVEEEEDALYNIDEEDEGIDNPVVVEMYKQASLVGRRVLEMLIKKCSPGVTITSLCEFGDNSILSVCKELVKGVEKYGIAVPTSVSPGTIICNYSPTPVKEKEEEVVIAGQDIRIDLAVHVDGYIAHVGTTVFLPRIQAPPGANHSPKIVSELDRTRTLCAAKRIMDLSMRMMKPGMGNFELGVLTKKLCSYYGVEFMRGMLSHQISRYVLRGARVILHRPSEDIQVFDHRFRKNEVYVLDISVSSNPKNLGRAREKDNRPCLYRREVSQHKMFLKSESSTRTLRYIDETFDHFYFPMRKIYESKAQMGFVELKQKGLVSCLPVLHGRRNESVVRLVATVAITGSEIIPFCVPPLQNTYLKDQLNLRDQKMINILQSNLKIDENIQQQQPNINNEDNKNKMDTEHE